MQRTGPLVLLCFSVTRWRPWERGGKGDGKVSTARGPRNGTGEGMYKLGIDINEETLRSCLFGSAAGLLGPFSAPLYRQGQSPGNSLFLLAQLRGDSWVQNFEKRDWPSKVKPLSSVNGRGGYCPFFYLEFRDNTRQRSVGKRFRPGVRDRRA